MPINYREPDAPRSAVVHEKRPRRGSIKRAVQDLVPVVQACALLAVAAHDGKIPLNEVLKLVRAAYRGEEKARCAG